MGVLNFLRRLLSGVLNFFRRLSKPFQTKTNRRRGPLEHKTVAPPIRRYTVKAIPRYFGRDDPPPLTWKACHPSTISRFKAELTCPDGHGMTLKGHTVSSDGTVKPSVVCPKHGCSFHEFVRLIDWDFGQVS